MRRGIGHVGGERSQPPLSCILSAAVQLLGAGPRELTEIIFFAGRRLP